MPENGWRWGLGRWWEWGRRTPDEGYQPESTRGWFALPDKVVDRSQSAVQKVTTIFCNPPCSSLPNFFRSNETSILKISKPFVDCSFTYWKFVCNLWRRCDWVGRLLDQPKDLLIRDHRSPTPFVSRTGHTIYSHPSFLSSHNPYICYSRGLRTPE